MTPSNLYASYKLIMRLLAALLYMLLLVTCQMPEPECQPVPEIRFTAAPVRAARERESRIWQSWGFWPLGSARLPVEVEPLKVAETLPT